MSVFADDFVGLDKTGFKHAKEYQITVKNNLMFLRVNDKFFY